MFKSKAAEVSVPILLYVEVYTNIPYLFTDLTLVAEFHHSGSISWLLSKKFLQFGHGEFSQFCRFLRFPAKYMFHNTFICKMHISTSYALQEQWYSAVLCRFTA